MGTETEAVFTRIEVNNERSVNFLQIVPFVVRPHIQNKCPGYDIKPSDSEAPALGDLESMEYLLIGVVAPDRVLIMDQIQLFWFLEYVQTNDLY